MVKDPYLSGVDVGQPKFRRKEGDEAARRMQKGDKRVRYPCANRVAWVLSKAL
jgi:hypothetical protein